MKLAIMQPYAFPYIGYFQLLNTVDRFVIYDDVQFSQEGWIHRNRIMANGKIMPFTIPLAKASHTNSISERIIARDRWTKERKKLLATIEQNYRKAPYFQNVKGLIEECILDDSKGLTDFILNSLGACCRYLDINTEILISSQHTIAPELKGEERIIAICKALGATHYVNAIGGMALYDKATFESHSIKLSFIKTMDIDYSQFNNAFIPWLSIIDVMMFNSSKRIMEYLEMFELI